MIVYLLGISSHVTYENKELGAYKLRCCRISSRRTCRPFDFTLKISPRRHRDLINIVIRIIKNRQCLKQTVGLFMGPFEEEKCEQTVFFFLAYKQDYTPNK